MILLSGVLSWCAIVLKKMFISFVSVYSKLLSRVISLITTVMMLSAATFLIFTIKYFSSSFFLKTKSCLSFKYLFEGSCFIMNCHRVN